MSSANDSKGDEAPSATPSRTDDSFRDEPMIRFTHQEDFNWAQLNNDDKGGIVMGKVFAIRDGHIYYKWQFKIETIRGGDPLVDESVSVYFYWVPDVKEGAIRTERLAFSIVNEEGVRKPGSRSTKPLTFNSEEERGWGWKKCFTFEGISSWRFSQNTIRLEADFILNRKLFDAATFIPKPPKTEPVHSILVDFFANIEDRKNSGGNFRIAARPEETDDGVAVLPRVFFVNTAILARKSERLTVLFGSSDWLENKEAQLQSTFSGAALYEMLRYVYTGEIGGNLCAAMPDVLDGAEDWGLQPLKFACQRQMIDRMIGVGVEFTGSAMCDMATDYLIAADRYELPTLKKICVNTLVSCLTEFLRSSKCAQLLSESNGRDLVAEVTDTASQLLTPYRVVEGTKQTFADLDEQHNDSGRKRSRK